MNASDLSVRIHPVGTPSMAVASQFRATPPIGDRVLLLRTVREDPHAIDLGLLPVTRSSDLEGVAEAWTAAQLAADATWLGLGLGVRVVLVPEAHRWHADLVIISKGQRLRGTRGHADARRALLAVRRSLVASLAELGEVPSPRPGPSMRPAVGLARRQLRTTERSPRQTR
jgi:hypothetical protein